MEVAIDIKTVLSILHAGEYGGVSHWGDSSQLLQCSAGGACEYYVLFFGLELIEHPTLSLHCH